MAGKPRVPSEKMAFLAIFGHFSGVSLENNFKKLFLKLNPFFLKKKGLSVCDSV
jgi:hypothetical protein